MRLSPKWIRGSSRTVAERMEAKLRRDASQLRLETELRSALAALLAEVASAAAGSRLGDVSTGDITSRWHRS